MAIIDLGTPQNILVNAQQTLSAQILTIGRVIENVDKGFVKVKIKELDAPLTLWDDTTTPTYAAKGDWTMADVISRVPSVITTV